MTKLSVCIPVEVGMSPPDYLVGRLLADAASSIEVVVGVTDDASRGTVLASLGPDLAGDARLQVVKIPADSLSTAQFWIEIVGHARGEWLSIVNPQDMIEPDLPQLIEHVEHDNPGVDAIGWNAFQIDAQASPDLPASVVVPVLHNSTEMDKTRMLQAFFQWEGAQRLPVMPFGLYHGALRRGLVDTILAASGELSWLTVAPQYEWSARTIVFANMLVLSNRPLSAVDVRPFSLQDIPSALQGFPFTPKLGITATVGEIQARVLHELGAQWAGFNENFVRACLYDCVMEHDRSIFAVKAQRYVEALKRMPGGPEQAAGFRPQYMPHLPPNTSRGKTGALLSVDRFIGKARTAQEFYAVVNDIMTPVRIIIDADLRSKETATIGNAGFADSRTARAS